jgi:hypothetical protein
LFHIHQQWVCCDPKTGGSATEENVEFPRMFSEGLTELQFGVHSFNFGICISWTFFRGRNFCLPVLGHHAVSLRYYLEAAIVVSDFFSQPVPRAAIDDHVYKRMIKCCTHLQCHTQVIRLWCLSVCIFICRYFCPSIHPQPPTYLSVCLSRSICIHPSIHLSIYVSLLLFIHLAICPFIHL